MTVYYDYRNISGLPWNPPCKYDGHRCGRQQYREGLCLKHYLRKKESEKQQKEESKKTK